MTAQQRLARLAGLVPTRPSTAARTPFVVLVVLLLAVGMLALLLLNASLNQGSFELSELRRETEELRDEQQALQTEVDGFSAPDALAERARELGLVPGGPPVFLGPDGTVRGEPTPAPSPEPTDPDSDGTDIPDEPDRTEGSNGPEDPDTPPEPAPEEPGEEAL